MFDRATVVDSNFAKEISATSASAGASLGGIDRQALVELLDSQMASRHLDLVARELRATGKSFYTIGSSGHEGNAVIGRVLRHTDPAFLHYRSGGFMLERARKVPGVDMIRDTLLGAVASSDEPIAGGRHKVWGSAPLWVLPQTSTIASHLPKAVGTAIALRRAKRLGLSLPIPADSIVVCSFGDASTQHATAQSAFNAACYSQYSGLPTPILFVCEDNGLGISVETADNWVQANFSERRGLTYFEANGLDVVDAYEVVEEAVHYCRNQAAPVFLHLRTVRLLGHAGTDFEHEYRTLEDIAATELRDPVLATARRVVTAGVLRAEDVIERYEAMRARVRETARACVERPKLSTAAEVIAPLAPYHAERVLKEADRVIAEDRRIASFGGDALPETLPPRHLAAQINSALHDLMVKYDDVVLFGEDIARKGGVYYVTKGLQKRFGGGRVFNTLLDETTILGLAQGFGTIGALPIPEIQYLAYFHNAEDQIRGEACSLQYFSRGQFRNPMIVRIASFAYQKGFGGHFHNDNSVAALRDIPGLIVAAPGRGDDAVGMLRTAAALAKVDGRVVVFLEPIALYNTRDLYEDKDGAFCTTYPTPGSSVPFGVPRVYHGDATDLCIITYANGAYLSLRVARRLEREHGIRTRVVDLRWLHPLNEVAVAVQAASCKRTLVVDECRSSGGMAEPIITAIAERGGGDRVRRIAGLDTYIPLGPAAPLVLPSEASIYEHALAFCRSR